jgi:hypothetical protein
MKSIFKCRCRWWHESIREGVRRDVEQSIHELLRHVQMKGRNELIERKFATSWRHSEFDERKTFLRLLEDFLPEKLQLHYSHWHYTTLFGFSCDIKTAPHVTFLMYLLRSPCIDSWLHRNPIKCLCVSLSDTMINFYLFFF